MVLPPEYFEAVFYLGDAPDPLPAAFAIVTACNPEGVVVPDGLNTAADARLLQRLRDSGISHFRATGGSRDRSHEEPGWAVGLPKPDAIELGRSLRQLAIWWVEAGNLWLIDCANGSEAAAGRFDERIVGG